VIDLINRGARKLTGENLKVVWAEFSTLSEAVLQSVHGFWPIHTRPSLDLKARSRFRPVSLSLSMNKHYICENYGHRHYKMIRLQVPVSVS
jgi:hypothetical protein